MRGKQLRVDGRWLGSIGAWAGLKWTTLADGGCGTCDWTMQLPPTFSHPALRRGALVELLAGSEPAWAGLLSEPVNGDDGWSFHADGLYLAAGTSTQAGFLAFDADGNATTVPDTAIDVAIATTPVGLPWVRRESIGATALTVPTDGNPLMYLGDLLSLAATNASHAAASGVSRWGVGADRAVYLRADPTAPMWQMTPGSGRFGLADTDYASDVFLLYRSGANSYAKAHASNPDAAKQYGTVQWGGDATAMGILTAADADQFAQTLLDAGRPRLGWTNSVSPGRYQLTNMGGVPVDRSLVRGGHMVRLHGVLDTQGQPRPFVDFVVATAEQDEDADTLTLSPVGLVARDSLDDMLAQMVAPAAS